MAQVTRALTGRLAEMLAGAGGLPYAVGTRAELGSPAASPVVLAQSISHELADRTAGVQYPAVYVYCEKLTNELREKFRAFSGKARLVIEVRVSHDRLEELGKMLDFYVEAVTSVLDSRRGDWGNGAFYAGAYEVSFGPVKHGGKNFIQTAKVSLEVDVSAG